MKSFEIVYYIISCIILSIIRVVSVHKALFSAVSIVDFLFVCFPPEHNTFLVINKTPFSKKSFEKLLELKVEILQNQGHDEEQSEYRNKLEMEVNVTCKCGK